MHSDDLHTYILYCTISDTVQEEKNIVVIFIFNDDDSKCTEKRIYIQYAIYI